MEERLNELLSVGALLMNEEQEIRVEIIAGAEGNRLSVEEAFNQYQRFADHMGWHCELVSIHSATVLSSC